MLDESTYKRKALFWVTVLEVSIYDQLALLLWACVGTSWQESMVEEAHLPHGCVQEERREEKGPTSPFGGTPPVI
jgi:hypothetical protein